MCRAALFSARQNNILPSVLILSCILSPLASGLRSFSIVSWQGLCFKGSTGEKKYSTSFYTLYKHFFEHKFVMDLFCGGRAAAVGANGFLFTFFASKWRRQCLYFFHQRSAWFDSSFRCLTRRMPIARIRFRSDSAPLPVPQK